MSFFNRKKENIIIILDIGSSSVGGSVVSIKEDKIPVILYNVREQMMLKNDTEFKQVVHSMVTTLDVVLKKIEKNTSKISIKKIFCTLSSSWVISSTHIAKVEKKSGFTVNQKLIDNLIDEEVLKISRNITNEKKIFGGTTRIINVQNIQTKLNGYETLNPYNKKVRIAEIAIFVSVSSEKIIKTIEDKIARVFHSTIEFNSFSLVSFVAIRDIFNLNNFLFLDITGEVTDVSVVKNNVLLKNITFPLGKNFLIRKIASGFNTTIEEAQSLFYMFNAKSSDDITNSKIREIQNIVKKEWVDSFVIAMEDLSKDILIPYSIFITVDNDVQDFFVDILSENKFSKFILTNDNFEINVLDEKLVNNFCLLGNKETAGDSFMMLEAIYAERIIHSV